MLAYFRAIRDYGNIDGRTRRAEFWVFYLTLIALTIALRMAGDALGLARSNGDFLLGDLFALFNVIPLVTISMRRLHDLDRTGWWLLLPPAALVFACLPGTPGVNRYGPAPSAASPRPPAVSMGPGPALDAAAAPARDPVAEIERLARLRDAGTLTEAEFATLKARALGRGEVAR